MPTCNVCFRHCEIKEGSLGFCRARTCKDGVITASNYGKITSLALDPIEKKPLYHFHSGKRILSVGSYGCNLRCPFCQNDSISWSEEIMWYAKNATVLTPEALVQIALESSMKEGNIGIAYTYNEPLIGYEYVRDCAYLAKEAGLMNVMVLGKTIEVSDSQP